MSICIVRTSGIIIPSVRFYQDNYTSICCNESDLKRYEDKISKWYFVPFEGNPYYLNSKNRIKVRSDENEYEYGDAEEFFGYTSDYIIPNKIVAKYPENIIGICLSKEHPVSVFKYIGDTTKIWKDIYDKVAFQKIDLNNSFLDLESSENLIGKDQTVYFESMKLFGAELNNSGLYFYETMKSLTEECHAFAVSHGLFINRNSEYKLLENYSGIADCDFKGTDIPIIPLATFEKNGKIFLYSIYSDWDYGGISFSEIKIDK